MPASSARERRQAAPAALDARVWAARPQEGRAAASVGQARAAPPAAAPACAPEELRQAGVVAWDEAAGPPEAQRAAAAQPDAAARHAGEVAAAAQAPDGALRPAAGPEVAAPGAARQPAAEAREVGPDAEVLPPAGRPEPGAAAGLAVDRAAAVSADRRGRLPHQDRPAPGPRSWARSARGILSSSVASPTARSSQAAEREVCSCVFFSRNVLFKHDVINLHALGRIVARFKSAKGFISTRNRHPTVTIHVSFSLDFQRLGITTHAESRHWAGPLFCPS